MPFAAPPHVEDHRLPVTTTHVPVGRNPYLHIARSEPGQEDVGIRAFSGWAVGTESPEGNWGLDGMKVPQWLRDVHNRYSGRCYLLGTGPSLAAQLPLLHHLKDAYTFTCNRMAQWRELPFDPFVHCVTEPQPFLQWGRKIVPIYDYPQAQNRVGVMWWPVSVPGWLWCPKAPEEIQLRWQGFANMKDGEPFSPLPTGWASPLTIAQLASWMGFREFVFLGCDTSDKGQAWDVAHGRTVYPRNIRSILESFDRARSDIQRLGGTVYDCTPDGRLNQEGVLPYRDLKEVLGA